MNKIVYTTKPKPDSLPGFWEPGFSPFEKPKHIKYKELKGFTQGQACILENAFTKTECETLIRFMFQSPNFEPVGVQGMMDKKDEIMGSMRTSIWCPEIAEMIWDRLRIYLPEYEFGDDAELVATDWWQHIVDPKKGFNPDSGDGYWCASPIAISPLLRFMKYQNEGQHYAHYDASFIYPDHNFRSFKSMVIYLTTNEGAATRFIKDGQQNVPIWERKHEDWSRPVNEDEIIAKSECIQGNVLFFDHRICHDVQQYFGTEDRVIIRGDVIYEMYLDE